jgi:predicted PurR-regulated permease PerM
MGNICKTENGMGNFFEKNSCLEKKDSAADAEENRENARSCRQKVLYAAGLAGGLYAVLRYLLPLVAPFVFAFFIVRILYPQLCRAEKKLRIRKDILMAGFLLLLTGILAAGFFFLLSKGTAWAVKIGSESSAIKDQVNIAFENGCCRAEELLGRERGEIRTFFQDKGDEMAKTVGREILPKAADWTAKSCSFALRTGAFWGIGMIAAFWLCRDYARFSEWMKKSEIWENIDRILRMTGGYCRAQLKILVIISGITVLGLWIGKVRNGLWIGLLAGILDALPMIGTGIVLIPTAIWQLLNENPQGAVFASVTYVACIAARELLEPRLLGAQIGLPPVLMLLSVYAGVKVFGAGGIFLGPLYTVLYTEGLRQIFCRS